jgi:hypothetical protein
MPTIGDIDQAKETCVNELSDRISDARQLMKTSTDADSAKLADAIDQLKAERLVILTQQYVADLNDQAMQNALDVISQATTDMNTVAQTMKTVTDFISKVAAFLGAAATVVPALRGTNS